MRMPHVPGSAVAGVFQRQSGCIEMKPYIIPFIVDAESLILGVALGVVAALALIVIKNI